MTDMEYILDRVPLPELLAQAAEESIELAHALLKLRRAHDPANPTPVSKAGAAVQLEEELSDLLLCLGMCLGQLGYTGEIDPCPQGLMDYKLKRWADRLRAQEESADGP